MRIIGYKHACPELCNKERSPPLLYILSTVANMRELVVSTVPKIKTKPCTKTRATHKLVLSAKVYKGLGGSIPANHFTRMLQHETW